MISVIQAKGMKGLSFEQPLSRLNLVLGPNGAGKSARSDALLLALLGYMPGVAKKNGEILDTYGSGDILFVEMVLSDRTHLGRRWSRDNKGTVSENFMVDRRRTARDEYMKAISGIKILDLKAFMDLSDQKKIDRIFALFPPGGDIGEIDRKIEQLKGKQNILQGRIQSILGTDKIEGTISRLRSARAAIQLPAGTLSEITAQIGQTENQLLQARKELQEARIEAARIEAEGNLERERERLAAEARTAAKSEVYEQHQAELRQVREEARQVVVDPVPTQAAGLPRSALRPALSISLNSTADPEESIKAILDAMRRTGCTACTAALICKRELRKYQKGAAA